MKSGRDLAREGAARAYAAADEEWKRAARRCLKALCLRSASFTTDRLWRLLRRRGVAAPAEGRAIAGVLAYGKHRGWCYPTDQTRASSSRRCHARRKTVWGSLIVTK
jgi:hypothetical protein